jgi:hypothetical protein
MAKNEAMSGAMAAMGRGVSPLSVDFSWRFSGDSMGFNRFHGDVTNQQYES